MIPRGESLYSLAEHPSLNLVFGCYSGRCGICLVEVLEGEENLNPPNELEEMLLDSPGKGKCLRLGCQCEVKGPVSFSTKTE